MSKIVTLFMEHPGDPGFIRAMVHDYNVETMVNMGWRETPPAPQIPDPDKGFGEVGSMQWHTHKIMELEDKEAVENYVREACDEDIDKRGSLDTVKQKALDILKRHHAYDIHTVNT